MVQLLHPRHEEQGSCQAWGWPDMTDGPCPAGAHGLEGQVDASRRASPCERRARAPGNGVQVLGEGREPRGAHKAARDTDAVTRKTGATSPARSER